MMVRRKKDKAPRPVQHPLERVAFAAITHIGSLTSIVVHTVFFVGIFALGFVGFPFEQILLILTTAVSLEAIYLAIFIQMTVNRQGAQLAEVSEDVEDISEDVEEISKDIDEIQEDVEEISEDVDDLSEEFEREELEDASDLKKIERIETLLGTLLEEVKAIKSEKR